MTISDPGIGGRKGGSVGICQKGARNGMMGMAAAVGWLVGWRINGGEIGGGKAKEGKAALMMPLHLRAILIRGCAWRGKRIQRHS